VLALRCWCLNVSASGVGVIWCCVEYCSVSVGCLGLSVSVSVSVLVLVLSVSVGVSVVFGVGVVSVSTGV
jgi:hypothetical protein